MLVTFRYKDFFFDRARVLSQVKGARLRVLRKAGGLTRLIARRSIRRAGKRSPSSQPGQPPKSRTGLLRDFIFFIYDERSDTVVIGPAKLNKVTLHNGIPAPNVLEYGGRVNVRDRKTGRMKFAKIEPRPYMQPAFDKMLEQFPPMLKDMLE